MKKVVCEIRKKGSFKAPATFLCSLSIVSLKVCLLAFSPKLRGGRGAEGQKNFVLWGCLQIANCPSRSYEWITKNAIFIQLVNYFKLMFCLFQLLQVFKWDFHGSEKYIYTYIYFKVAFTIKITCYFHKIGSAHPKRHFHGVPKFF